MQQGAMGCRPSGTMCAPLSLIYFFDEAKKLCSKKIPCVYVLCWLRRPW